jgi:hypothetical protein
VLTVEGAYFPSRVGASLYSSLLDGDSDTQRSMQQLKDLMVLPSLKEAEDMSIRLLRRRAKNIKHHRAGVDAVRSTAAAALTQTLLTKLTAATSLPSKCGTSAHRPVGFFDSTAAVSKLVYGLESLLESEAFVSPEYRFLSKSIVSAGDSRSSHGHVVLCKHKN